MDITKKVLNFQGAQVSTWTHGKGPKVLCLHGFPTSSRDFIALTELDLPFEFVAFDFLGFGDSRCEDSIKYSIKLQADLAESVMVQLGIHECFLLAHDYGDSVAQELLSRNSGCQFKKVILLNGGLFPESHNALWVQKLLLSPLGKWVALLGGERAFKKGLARTLGPLNQNLVSFIDDSWDVFKRAGTDRIVHKLIHYMTDRRVNRERWVEALKSNQERIILAIGLLDPVSGKTLCKRYRELFPEGKIVEFPELGHYPQVEDPKAVAQTIKDFFLD